MSNTREQLERACAHQSVATFVTSAMHAVEGAMNVCIDKAQHDRLKNLHDALVAEWAQAKVLRDRACDPA